MNSSKYVLRCMKKITIAGGSIDLNLHVLTLKAQPIERFELMCAAIDNDIPNFAAVGCVMDWIYKVVSSEINRAEVDGNAWVINITKEKVWFESLYSQGEGGEVSLSQFKLAVETYSKFLSDPEHQPIEVVFPEH